MISYVVKEDIHANDLLYKTQLIMYNVTFKDQQKI